MVGENLPEKIGFTANQQDTYYKYKKLIGDTADKFAKEYMLGNMTQKEALEAFYAEKNENVHKYTADLIFLLECSGYLLEKYKEKGLSEDLFIGAMCDIKYKLDECINVKGVFGTFVVWWFDGFFKMKRFAIGRLQYDVISFEEDEEYDGKLFKKGDLCLSCHIPSSGPLTPRLCTESYRLAYRFFSGRLTNGILPIKCSSWLLYPSYLPVFGEESNVGKFVKSFKIHLLPRLCC